MSSLDHNFILIKLKETKSLNNLNFYLKLLKLIENKISNNECEIIENITLHDDIFSYFDDMFSWIPVKGYDDSLSNLGVNRYGISIFNSESQLIFSNILSGLIKIFDVAPNDIELTSNLNFDDNDNKYFEKIIISKKDFLNKLLNLKKCIDKIDNTYYLIHLGI